MRSTRTGSADTLPAARTSVGHAVSGMPRGRWMTLGKDGRLTVYARTDGGLLRWTQRSPGGDPWDGPDFVPVAGLTDLTVVQGADAYVHFLGRRERRGAEGPAVDFVHAVQYQTGRPVTAWRSLGNFYRDREKGLEVGAPAGAVDAQGTVFVLARNAGGGLQLRREGKGGKWGAWQDLKGGGISAEIVASVTSGGLVEVFATGDRGVLQWRQDAPDGPLQMAPPLQFYALAGTATALETGAGRLTYYWTDAATMGMVSFRAGAWPVLLGGYPGEGAVVALRASLDGYDCTVLAQRGTGGTLLIGVCGTEGEQDGVWWSDTGQECVGEPALAVDGHGRVVVAVRGRDGAVSLTQQEPGQGLKLSAQWRQL
ncbi:hypothetical protein SAMN05216483_1254 [Streptomyces sp. 2131.1]|uniref:hypothetical protein n=1 Tax=Streptomyces sp. 2131.1 TaxID=1855346 RepID=UPI000898CEA1|nr:hypothetical protein [Streptomyces sp. 2131.1]SEC20065.1 hypothetical protein SAMN05216483_1254 [Streptomyces sp. 2131.1]